MLAIGTLRHALSQATERLAAANIEDASLEAEILLGHALDAGRVELFLNPDRQLSPEQSERFSSLLERRLNGEPSAYITGHREFFGLDFCVTPDVLIPRSETELLVETAIGIVGAGLRAYPGRTSFQGRTPTDHIVTIADIGTGSGCIAISLAKQLPGANIYATDISPAALKLAAANCQKHDVADRITLIEGDLLAALPEPVDLIIANLPYVRGADLASVNTHGFEPTLALDGGADGLDQIRRLCAQARRVGEATGGERSRTRRNPPFAILLEVGAGQAEAVAAILRTHFPQGTVEVTPDLAGWGRVVLLEMC